MTGAEVVASAQDALFTVAVISAPLLAVGTIVGIFVSLLRALTQIQELTLVYVPKTLATFITFLIALPFMADVSHHQFLRMVARVVAP